MLALLLIPALLGLALIMDGGDDTEADSDIAEDVDPIDPPQTGPDTTATLTGNQDFSGFQGADRVEGSDAANEISGQGGNDFLQGFGGNDSIFGGTGNDIIYAGDGNDAVEGGFGNDRIFLGDGDDTYTPIEDDDADRGNDFVRGGAGDDGVIDLSGSDTVYGDSGDDILATFGTGQTPDAPDTIDGGAGDDALFGDNADVMTGGTGSDIFSIIKPANSPSEEVIITDFNTTDDTLTLFVPDADSNTETVDLRYDPAENLVRAFWRGDEVAVLNGLTNADIPNIQVAVFDAQDLSSGNF